MIHYNVLDDFFKDGFFAPTQKGVKAGTGLYSQPRVDIHETAENYLLKADLPGLDQKDVNLEYRDGVLSLSGKREYEHETKEDDFVSRERYMGSFQRSFNLGQLVDADQIEASMKDGVLKVTLPKKGELTPKKITVK